MDHACWPAFGIVTPQSTTLFILFTLSKTGHFLSHLSSFSSFFIKSHFRACNLDITLPRAAQRRSLSLVRQIVAVLMQWDTLQMEVQIACTAQRLERGMFQSQ